jgi:threonine/homoserine/homoserine lactone efflux protein
MPETVSPALTGLTLGIALAGAPGAVQAVFAGEAIRGGTSRGLRALAGAHLTFGVLLVGMALGFSLALPGGSALQIMKVAGGVFLLWLAAEGFRAVQAAPRAFAEQRTLPPAARGALAVLLNPGAWLSLAQLHPRCWRPQCGAEGSATRSSWRSR